MIRAILVDDEQPALEELEFLLKDYPVEIAAMIQNSKTVLEQVGRLKPDVVFLDIDMPGANGLEIALKIQEIYTGIQIIFVTAYSEYALKAFRAYPLDYILKPVNETRFAKTMQHLLKSVESAKANTLLASKPHIRCFGTFEAFTENGERQQMKFATRQTREMFAYLISHFEKAVSRDELIHVIFGGNADKKTVNLLHVTAYKLRHTMEELGIDRESITLSGNYTLEVADGICDYIDFAKFTDRNPYIDQDNAVQAEAAAKLYQGPFLESEDYLWAEEARAEMELRFESLQMGIAAFYRQAGKISKCEKALVTLLKYNDLSEQGNRALLNLYIETKGLSKFREHYEKYRTLLKEELQIKPDRKFFDYYEKIK